MSNYTTVHGHIAIIGRGKASWHAKYTSDVTIYADGHRSTTSVSSDGGTLERYAAEAPDGTPVYDAMAADSDLFAHNVIAGPMVNADLDPGMMAGWDGPIPYVVCMAGSLHYIAVDVHIERLRAIPGMRFGVVMSGVVVWS